MKRSVFWLCVLAVFCVACGSNRLRPAALSAPPQLDDGLAVGTPEEVGLNTRRIQSAIDGIEAGEYGQIHALLIYVDGKLVVERYFPGHDYQWDAPGHRGAWVEWDASTRHIVHSVGKSVTSACVGIAIDHGFIESVDDSIFRYLPEHQHFATDGREAITIEHLLTMTSGLAWDEWGASYVSGDNDLFGIWFTEEDPVSYILKRPMVSEPGSSFCYNGGNMVLLAEIIRYASGMDIQAFAGEYLFAPLGIDTPPWHYIDDTVIYGGGDQHLTPREMCKFGVTFLDGGTWQGERIISEAWVTRSSQPYDGPDNAWFNHFLRPIPPDDNTWGRRGYAYAWWTQHHRKGLKRVSTFSAQGWAGQRILVVPDHDAVVVLTAANYGGMDSAAEIVRKHIIPALP